MDYIQRYLAEEFAGDYREGYISRREFIHRLTLVMGSAAAALVMMETLGCAPEPSATPTATAAPPALTPPPPAPATTTARPTSTATPAPSPTVGPASTATPSPTTTRTAAPTATQPAAPTAPPTATRAAPSGETVSPDDPTIEAGPVSFRSKTGILMLGYLSRPRAQGTYPGVLVIHENRGMLPHFPDVTRRLAKEGYAALAIDLASREGGTAKFADSAEVSGILARASRERVVEDMNAGLDYLRGLSYVQRDRLGAIGFCFGGGMVWLLAVSNPELKAAVPFYGPRPPLQDVLNMQAAVLGMYAENDNFVNPGVPDLEAALKANRKAYQFKTYPGTGHGFFNDTGARYNAEAVRAAWKDTLDWFSLYLKGVAAR